MSSGVVYSIHPPFSVFNTNLVKKSHIAKKWGGLKYIQTVLIFSTLHTFLHLLTNLHCSPQAAHNCFIATSTVPGLFLLSTDDPSAANGVNDGKADIQGSSGAKDQETTKLVEADSSNETPM